jgi:hypothetical protein
MIIAWRINRLMRLGRTLPDLPADVLSVPVHNVLRPQQSQNNVPRPVWSWSKHAQSTDPDP